MTSIKLQSSTRWNDMILSTAIDIVCSNMSGATEPPKAADAHLDSYLDTTIYSAKNNMESTTYIEQLISSLRLLFESSFLPDKMILTEHICVYCAGKWGPRSWHLHRLFFYPIPPLHELSSTPYLEQAAQTLSPCCSISCPFQSPMQNLSRFCPPDGAKSQNSFPWSWLKGSK